jgi:hypothetical protein
MRIMTSEQAYAAIFHFLEPMPLRTKSDDLRGHLGEMSLLEDVRRRVALSSLTGEQAFEYALKVGDPAPLELR